MAEALSVPVDTAARLARNAARQARIELPPEGLPSTAKALRSQLRSYLLQCFDADAILDPPDAILKKLRGYASGGAHVITVADSDGQPKNFRRDRALAHFTRADGAWFDFGFTLLERRGAPVEVVAYDAELRFVRDDDSPVPPWVRFDLNPPGHDNDGRALRSHLHPATDDWEVPAPTLSPVELLDLLVFGCCVAPGRAPRA
ncbi:MAG: hypothetical protein R3A52_02940 [Polyangiales bacterium]